MSKHQKMSRRLSFVKKRALKKGIPCDLTLPQLKVILKGSGTECPCCRLPFDGSSKKKCRTLDRIEPALGYTYANLQVLCDECNQKKGQAVVRYTTQSY